MADETPICSLCKKPMVELVERTEIAHQKIFVCATKPTPKKMPCDGGVYDIASRRI